jgi:hypothetical protein
LTPPPKDIPNITLVIDPFDYFVWISIIIVSILIPLIKGLFIKQYVLVMKIFAINRAIINSSFKRKLSRHSSNDSPLRIMICCWLLSCIVLTSSYSGSLYSLMAFPSYSKTIDTLVKLSIDQKNNEIQVIAVENTIYYEYLKVCQTNYPE